MTGPPPGPPEDGEPPFPETVLVGYRRYRIVCWPPVHAAAAGLRGCGDHAARQVLVVREGVDPLEVAEVLVHELFHCLLIPAGCAAAEAGDPGNGEERLATVLGHGLTALMSQNPGLRAWLCWAWAGTP